MGVCPYPAPSASSTSLKSSCSTTWAAYSIVRTKAEALFTLLAERYEAAR